MIQQAVLEPTQVAKSAPLAPQRTRLKVALKVALALGLGIAGGAVSPHASNLIEAAGIGTVIAAVFAFMFLVKAPKGVALAALPLLFTF